MMVTARWIQCELIAGKFLLTEVITSVWVRARFLDQMASIARPRLRLTALSHSLCARAAAAEPHLAAARCPKNKEFFS